MFYIKQNDTSPAIQKTCLDSTETAVNVTGATVRFHMRDTETKAVKVDAAGAVVDGVGGIVKYEWDAADTDVVGDYEAEFEITYADSKIETFPNTTYIKVRIVDDIT